MDGGWVPVVDGRRRIRAGIAEPNRKSVAKALAERVRQFYKRREQGEHQWHGCQPLEGGFPWLAVGMGFVKSLFLTRQIGGGTWRQRIA